MPTNGEATDWHSDGHLLYIWIGADPIVVCPFECAVDAPCSAGAMQDPGTSCRLSVLYGVGVGEIYGYFVGESFEVHSPVELVWRERFDSEDRGGYWYLELQSIEAFLQSLRAEAERIFLACKDGLLELMRGRPKRELESIWLGIEHLLANDLKPNIHEWWLGNIATEPQTHTCRFTELVREAHQENSDQWPFPQG